MKLTHITASGFMRPVDTALTPVTSISGRNNRGKSAHLRAIEIALTGSRPGKTPGSRMSNGEIFDTFSSENTMRVSAQFDDTQQCILEISKNRKGFDVAKRVGQREFPATLFHSSEFWNLSGPARVRYLFGALPAPAGFESRASVALVIGCNIKNIKLDPHTLAAETAIDALVKYVNEYSVLESISIQDWLTGLSESVRVKANGCAAHAKTMKSTILGNTQLRAPDAESQATAEKRKRDAQTALTKAETELATAREQFRQLNSEITKKQTVADSYVAPEPGAREKLESRIAELRALVAKPLPELAPEADQESALKAQAAYHDALTTVGSLQRQMVDINTTINLGRKEMDRFHALKCCPTCKAKGTKWKDEVMQDMATALTAKEVQLAQWTEDHKQADARYKSATETAERIRVSNAAATKARAESVAASQSASRLAIQYQNELNETNARFTALVTAVARQLPARAAAAELPGMRERLAALHASGGILNAKVTSLKTQYMDAESALAIVHGEIGKANAAALAAEQADAAETEAKVTKEASKIIAELVAKCVTASIEPFLATCNALCEGILDTSLVYRDGDIGIMEGDKFVSASPGKSMGGTYSTLTNCALCIALAAGQPFRLAIIDEVGNLDDVNALKLTVRLCELVTAGKIDQALIVGTRAAPYPGDGYRNLFSSVKVG